jgi:potassium-dependent mechanosensitive channel
MQLLIKFQLCAAILLWQERQGAFWRAWNFINHSFKPLGDDRIVISVATLVWGLIILAVAIVVSRWLSALFEKRIAKRAHISPGIAYTIGRLTKYAVTTVGIFLFLQAAFAINFTSLAVLFTALSVGIGFGLQYIAADIASGFILLFERPIRVGDRITIGEDEGDVQSINLRTTTVITNDRIAIIVPNSKLVSQRVINWSYGDPRARIPIPISVAVNSDIQLVTETLLLAAEGVDRVLTDPPPKVQFLSFGGYSLDFRLLIWTRHPSRHPQIRSDINYRIEKLFRERGIEIPVPIQEFLVKTQDAAKLTGDLLADDKTDSRESTGPGDGRNSPRQG